MPNPKSYLTIERESVAEFRDRGSRFIAYAFPVSDIGDIKKKIALLKKEHHKAVHHCFAYRIGYEGDQYRINDDGEPSGTAGLPILGQIDSRKLTFTAVVVVRYFGGTLLGKPGLINAYKSVSSDALQVASIVEKTVDLVLELRFDYGRLDEVMHHVKQLSCTVTEKDLGLFCIMRIRVPVSLSDKFEQAVKGIHDVEINILL